jgi:hypothetical protein
VSSGFMRRAGRLSTRAPSCLRQGPRSLAACRALGGRRAPRGERIRAAG